MNVVTRIPPSPTGRFHIGLARTALFNYLFARHHGGTFLFRSEDTDKARSKKEFEDEIIEGFRWLGLAYDAFSRQSENAPRHQELLQKLVGEGKAYVSKEESKDEVGKFVELIRLKNPGRSLTFHDEVHGDIIFDTTELKDFVIARSISDPLYHFAVVVDDWDSGVTHVIRGEDHISNTPRQILIQEALGAPRPIYAHLPLILDEKRAKLSKRTGATSVMDYRAQGFLPEALVNYLALLGWSPGSNREDFSLSELVQTFSLESIQKSGAAWDREKLLSVNQRWMRKLSNEEFLAHLGDIRCPPSDVGHRMSYIVALLKERARTFGEARELLAGELSCLFNPPTLDKITLTSKGGDTRIYLVRINEMIESLEETLPADSIKANLMPYADEQGRAKPGDARSPDLPSGGRGRGAVLWPLRYALSGQERSPDPFTLIALLGKAEAISRLQAAIGILE
ncbi:MAG: glutamate--tRNA ligase family protein [bacterium]|nr:glutamate--tRNA ligase family protein [bacterium]